MAWFLNDFSVLDIFGTIFNLIPAGFFKSERTNQMQLSKFDNNISGPIIGTFDTESGESSAPGQTFLLIDDEPMITDICELMLKKLGYEVLKANSGSEGLKIFEANKNRIDLIISDYNMPGMNGQEVVDKVRVIDHSVKVLLSSGGLSVPHEEDALGRGFNGFLQKPYSIDLLSDKIAEVLN